MTAERSIAEAKTRPSSVDRLQYSDDALLALSQIVAKQQRSWDHQDDAWAVLEAVTKHLPPGCPVQLPVSAVFLRPLLLPLDGRPVRLPAESARLEKLCERLRLEAAKSTAEEVVQIFVKTWTGLTLTIQVLRHYRHAGAAR